ncbi:MAG: RHS repeat-associated core domain-containing protein [Candidatus Electrothrix sp. GW3-4]|uniref:RHS repeat domain-containing protein n=1 Tax=Candidatus Electrothrix sp. GW3-4 TaxID=3126740 RepID=UPI0030CA7359
MTDHLGAPQIITDDSGSVVWKAEYLPFGKVNISVADIENNLRFPGQYYDVETGLHYNWNRYYSPETGRYIASDPIGLGGGINLYAYVGSDPVNGVDPEGLNALVIKGLEWGGRLLMAAMGAKAAQETYDAVKDRDASGNDQARQAEYDRYKARCNERPPGGLDQCEKWRWLLQRNKDCRDMRQAWDDKWQPGRHQNDIDNLQRGIDKLQDKINRYCCGE